MSKNEPAFPQSQPRYKAEDDDSGQTIITKIGDSTVGGITKLEYFAAHGGITFKDAIRTLNVSGFDVMAKLAKLRYDYAEAMIKEGEKRDAS